MAYLCSTDSAFRIITNHEETITEFPYLQSFLDSISTNNTSASFTISQTNYFNWRIKTLNEWKEATNYDSYFSLSLAHQLFYRFHPRSSHSFPCVGNRNK